MKLRWVLWSAASVLWLLYVSAAYLASHTEQATIRLQPGFSVDFTLYRFAGDRPRMWLGFVRQPGQSRPELGEGTTLSQGAPPGSIAYVRPGTPVKLLVALAGMEEVAYEALPAGGFSVDRVDRLLTADLATAPCIWPRLRPESGLFVPWGINRLRAEVVAVGPELAGETVQLIVDPLISLKGCHPNLCWLQPGWLAAPLIFAVQMFWLAVLLILPRRRRSERDRPAREDG